MTEKTEEQQPDLMEQAITGHPPALTEREPRALAEFQAGGALAAMIPQTAEEYGRMAKLLMDAGCVPASYDGNSAQETRAKLIIGLMKSVEIGVPPITGLNGIMIVNNRPSVWGDFAMSLIHRSGQLDKMEVLEVGIRPEPGAPLNEWDRSYGYRVLMWRRGNETAFAGEFTVNDARRANLWENTSKRPWIYYPKDMLFNRARARAANRGFADALHGLGIVEEERDLTQNETKRDLSNLLADKAPEEAIEEAEIEEVTE